MGKVVPSATLSISEHDYTMQHEFTQLAAQLLIYATSKCALFLTQTALTESWSRDSDSRHDQSHGQAYLCISQIGMQADLDAVDIFLVTLVVWSLSRHPHLHCIMKLSWQDVGIFQYPGLLVRHFALPYHATRDRKNVDSISVARYSKYFIGPASFTKRICNSFCSQHKSPTEALLPQRRCSNPETLGKLQKESRVRRNDRAKVWFKPFDPPSRRR